MLQSLKKAWQESPALTTLGICGIAGGITHLVTGGNIVIGMGGVGGGMILLGRAFSKANESQERSEPPKPDNNMEHRL
ncbi:MAG: hypothetical protein H6860_03625 [Rhodospirillales bacterium]|nr:hypothetical protein [Rhodospirillales bacterium]